ncbi:hypothetical protein ACVWZN_002088 [Lysobacter sp. HA35]
MKQRVGQSDQTVLGVELFALHPREFEVIDGTDAEFGIHDPTVEILMALIELFELGMGVDEPVELVRGPFFEHANLLGTCIRRHRPPETVMARPHARLELPAVRDPALRRSGNGSDESTVLPHSGSGKQHWDEADSRSSRA